MSDSTEYEFENNMGRTWAEIDLNICRNNVLNIKNLLKNDCKLMYVIKADAYGHGAEAVSKTVENIVDSFAVATIEEAISLREYGVAKPILILGYTPVNNAENLYKYNITQTVYSKEYGISLASKLKKTQKIKIHIKIDTGMSRLGFYCHDDESIKKAEHEINILYNETCKNLEFEGIYTHFATSDMCGEDNIAFAKFQFENFCRLTELLKQKGLNFALKHCCNSAATINYPEMHLDMVRPGLILYGHYPDYVCKNVDVKPMMSIKSIIAQIHNVKAGDTIGYGRTFKAEKEMKIATIPIGYADGFSRILSNKSSIIINGKIVPIIGNICMDQTVADISETNAYEFQTVTIIGKEEDSIIKVEDFTKILGTISYEFITRIGNRVKKHYINNPII